MIRSDTLEEKAAFDRFSDLMAKLMIKYGPDLLKRKKEELEKAAGGVQEWCLGNYACIDLYNSPESDEYDHNGMCITVWHCLTAFLHTDHGDSNNVLCWSNYQCVKWNN